MDEEKRYALNIRADDNRILSATYEECAAEGMPIVDSLPAGETAEENDISNYKYIDGEYIYDPLPQPEPPEPQPQGEYVTYDELAEAIREGVNSYGG